MLKGKLKAGAIDADGGGRLTVEMDGVDHVISIPQAGVEQMGSRGILHRGEGRLSDQYRGETIELRSWTSWRVGGQSGRGDRFEND